MKCDGSSSRAKRASTKKRKKERRNNECFVGVRAKSVIEDGVASKQAESEGNSRMLLLVTAAAQSLESAFLHS
jgi:hypothetical protein